MTDDNWDEFNSPLDRPDIKRRQAGKVDKESSFSGEKQDGDSQLTGCDWGQSEPVAVDGQGNQYGDSGLDSSKFIPIYERYLEDKRSILQQTKNYKLYSRNPQKYLRDWFEYQGHEFKVDSDQPSENQYICSIDLPIDEHEFTVTSELHATKKGAIDEVCLDACRMLDDCQLLCSNTTASGADQQEEDDDGEDLERKRRIDEANKEDDIVFDSTKRDDVKRHCNEANQATNNKPSSLTGTSCSTKPKVNTYKSLMAQWRETNMAILQLKARLVKLDLSVTGSKQRGVDVKKQTIDTKETVATLENSHGKGNDNNKDEDSEEDDIDPLDEFMSNLDKKTALSMDEKIEKSRIKSQIATYEKDQSKLERLIELAKPSYART